MLAISGNNFTIMYTVVTRLNATAFINFLAFPTRRYPRASFISNSYFLNH